MIRNLRWIVVINADEFRARRQEALDVGEIFGPETTVLLFDH